jgi:hypothetical protein
MNTNDKSLGCAMAFALTFLLALLGASAPGTAEAQAAAGRRVALIIGNAAYPTSPLSNPGNDARAVSGALKGLGFTVIEARDASKLQMEQAITQTQQSLQGGGGVGLLYYAGHGLQLDWRNYLVPVDARLGSARDVAAQTVDVQKVLDAFKAAGNAMSIIVLDACRDNPFGATGRSAGLAPMDAQWGTFLAYATAPGNVAEDGTGDSGNSLYTRHLVQELKQPGARIEDVFKRVRLQVRQLTQGRQVPWESTSLEEEFYFDPAVKALPARVPEVERLNQDEANLLLEKADWDRIKASNHADDFYAYLKKYPGGFISEQAQFRLDQLQRAKVVPSPRANGIVALAAGLDRYAVGDEWVMERTDDLTKETRRITSRVTQADRDWVVINDGAAVYDQMGSVLKNRFGVKDPGILMAPADLALGKRWRSAFTNTQPGGLKLSNFYDFRVTAFEEVTVPAGTFNAFRVERHGLARAQNGPGSQISGTTWIDPITMFPIRNDMLFRTKGVITEQSSDRLVRIKRAPRNP